MIKRVIKRKKEFKFVKQSFAPMVLGRMRIITKFREIDCGVMQEAIEIKEGTSLYHDIVLRINREVLPRKGK